MRKDIALTLAGAILGAAVSFLFSSFEPSKPQHFIVIGFFVILALGSISIVGPLRLILSSQGKTRLSGDWSTEWSYLKKSKKVTILDTLRIKQIGRYILGSGQSNLVTGPHPFTFMNYKITGEVKKDGTIEGQWWNTNKGRNYQGTFLGRIHVSGKIVELIWLGTDDGGIHSGQWKWSRV